MKKPLTDKEYIMHGALCCPVCHEPNVEHIPGEGPEPDYGKTLSIEWETQCGKCDATWCERYEMVGINQIIDADNKAIKRDDQNT